MTTLSPHFGEPQQHLDPQELASVLTDANYQSSKAVGIFFSLMHSHSSKRASFFLKDTHSPLQSEGSGSMLT